MPIELQGFYWQSKCTSSSCIKNISIFIQLKIILITRSYLSNVSSNGSNSFCGYKSMINMTGTWWTMPIWLYTATLFIRSITIHFCWTENTAKEELQLCLVILLWTTAVFHAVQNTCNAVLACTYICVFYLHIHIDEHNMCNPIEATRITT